MITNVLPPFFMVHSVQCGLAIDSMHHVVILMVKLVNSPYIKTALGPPAADDVNSCKMLLTY